MKYIKRIQYNSPVILTFTIICLIVLFLGYITDGYSTEKLFSVYRTSFSDILSYIRVFTYVVGHINFEHFFNNFLIILIVGPMLEEKYGSYRILILIIMTALITGIIQMIISKNALIGSSGIAFMLIILTSFTNVKEGFIPLTTIFISSLYLGKEIYYAFISNDNISQMAHIVGGICGIFIGYMINKRLKI